MCNPRIIYVNFSLCTFKLEVCLQGRRNIILRKRGSQGGYIIKTSKIMNDSKRRSELRGRTQIFRVRNLVSLSTDNSKVRLLWLWPGKRKSRPPFISNHPFGCGLRRTLERNTSTSGGRKHGLFREWYVFLVLAGPLKGSTGSGESREEEDLWGGA